MELPSDLGQLFGLEEESLLLTFTVALGVLPGKTNDTVED